jgi:hypothetical protein
MNIISASSPRCLQVALSHVEQAPLLGASDFGFGFNRAFKFGLEVRRGHFPAPILMLITHFPIARIIRFLARSTNGAEPNGLRRRCPCPIYPE